jgi:deoxyadenosine/deoxycytidine kinase
LIELLAMVSTSKQRYIAVAGNMGAGKSTLVQFLATQFNGEAFYEPVDENPYFARFFKNMRKWAFHSQIYFLTHKFKIHQAIQKRTGLVVIDRSIYEDAEIFAKGLYKAKKMSADEFELYWALYESMCETLKPPDLLIYLSCSIETLKERIHKRGRGAEKNVPDEHLILLQDAYDDWVKRVDFCEVVHIKTDNLDYIGDLVHRAHVVEHLAKYI